MNFGECPRRFARSTSLCALVALFLLGGETRAQTVHGSWSDSSPEPPLEGYTVTLELLDALPTQTIHGREVRRARVGTDLHFRVRLTNESGFPMSAGSFSQTFSFQRISRVLPKPPGVDEFPAPLGGVMVSAKLYQLEDGESAEYEVTTRCVYRGRDVVRAVWGPPVGAFRNPTVAVWIDCHRDPTSIAAPGTDPNTSTTRPKERSGKPSFWFGGPARLEDKGPFDVKHCGAKGDGKTDDTDAIQRCIDRAHARFVNDGRLTQSRVFFPPGRYYVTKRFLVPDSVSEDDRKVDQWGALYLRSGVELYGVSSMRSVVTLRWNPEPLVLPISQVPDDPGYRDCQGQACTYLFVAGWPVKGKAGGNASPVYQGAGPGVGVSMHDLVLEGDESLLWEDVKTRTNHAAVAAYRVENFDFQDLEIRGWYRGLALTSVTNMVVRDSTFINNKYQAIGLWGGVANSYLNYAAWPGTMDSPLTPEKLPIERGLIQDNDFSNQTSFIGNLDKVRARAALAGNPYVLILLGVYLSGRNQEISFNDFKYTTPVSLKGPGEVLIASNTSSLSLYFARIGHTERSGGVAGRVVVEDNLIRKSVVGIEVETCSSKYREYWTIPGLNPEINFDPIFVAPGLESRLGGAPADLVIIRGNTLSDLLARDGPGSDPFVTMTHGSKHGTFTNAAIRVSESAGVTIEDNVISGLLENFHVAGIHIGTSQLTVNQTNCWLALAPSHKIRVTGNEVTTWSPQTGVPLYVENTIDSMFEQGGAAMTGTSHFYATPSAGLNVSLGSLATCFGGPSEVAPPQCPRRLDVYHPLNPERPDPIPACELQRGLISSWGATVLLQQ